MRVVHYLESIRLEHGGVVRAVLDLVEALDDHGVEVVLATHDDTDVPPEWAERSIRIFPLGRRLRGLWIRSPDRRRLAGQFAEADAVHLHGVWELGSWQLARLCRRTGTPYVVSVHGMLDDWCMAQSALKKRVYLRLFGRARLGDAAAVHLTAEAERDQARKWIPHDRLAVIPLIMNLQPFLDAPAPSLARAEFPALQHGEPVALFISRVHPKKGVHHLIRASRALIDRGLAHRVVIAGPGDRAYLAELDALVRELGLGEVVSFVGTVMGELKCSLYRAADAVVLPTSQENFGFVLFEALASGTPVITTTGSDTWPSLKASGGAIITACPPGEGELAGAMETLLADPAEASERGARGQQWARESLNADRTANRFIELYSTGAIADDTSAPEPRRAPG